MQSLKKKKKRDIEGHFLLHVKMSKAEGNIKNDKVQHKKTHPSHSF